VLAERAARAPSKPQPEVVAPVSHRHIPPAAEREIVIGIHAGYLAFASRSPGDLSAGLDVGLRLARLRVGLALELSLPSTLRVDAARLSLSRQALAVDVGLKINNSEEWVLGPWFRAGVNRVSRKTTSESDALIPTSGQTSAALGLGIGLFGGWALAEPHWLLIWAGANAEFPRREYVVARATTTETVSARTWVLQPTLRIGWEVQF